MMKVMLMATLSTLMLDPLVQKVLLQTAFRVSDFGLEGAVNDCAGVVSFGVEGTVADSSSVALDSLVLKVL